MSRQKFLRKILILLVKNDVQPKGDPLIVKKKLWLTTETDTIFWPNCKIRQARIWSKKLVGKLDPFGISENI